MEASGYPTSDTMLYVGGSKQPFRCEKCGANVFKKASETADSIKYRCNGCAEVYVSERSAR